MSENRLGAETSPYLLQHRDNPVHWWAWGPDALAEAKRTGKPILLSVGYAACHWCHVMAHESFEDASTAAVMNALFVNIKVDREERPDIDAIYMAALHRLSEHGGWPLTMFLDSDARPFWGGTYFPPTPRYGKPSFVHVLQEVARIFTEERDKVDGNATAILGSLEPERHPNARVTIGDGQLADISARLVRAIDAERGGMQGAPKFPQWNIFWLLWRGAIRYANGDARQAVLTTLDNICQGGIYDHLGGGFARYSVDDRWLVPHFEKMLYDNALLVDLLSECWRETRSPLYARRIAETIGWLEREMIAEGGGFAASLDADSGGEEGKFYVWSKAEIVEVLGAADAGVFSKVYDITDGGNFEGHNIPNRLGSMALLPDAEEAALAGMSDKLLARRTGRIRPGWDDKVLADWNGLMIAALVNAGTAFGRPEWIALARRGFEFVAARISSGDRLWHSFRAGKQTAPATSSDYANMIWGALRLYQATGEMAFLDRARTWAAALDKHYWDTEGGGYCMTADDTPDVIVRLRNAHDDATPNANAIMLTNLVQLFLLTGEAAYMERAQALPHAFAADLQRSLIGHSGLLANMIDTIAPQHVVVVGPEPKGGGLAAVLRQLSLPGAVQQVIADPSRMPPSPALSGKGLFHGKQTAYVCVGPQCSAPIMDAGELAAHVRSVRGWQAQS